MLFRFKNTACVLVNLPTPIYSTYGTYYVTRPYSHRLTMMVILFYSSSSGTHKGSDLYKSISVVVPERSYSLQDNEHRKSQFPVIVKTASTLQSPFWSGVCSVCCSLLYLETCRFCCFKFFTSSMKTYYTCRYLRIYAFQC